MAKEKTITSIWAGKSHKQDVIEYLIEYLFEGGNFNVSE